MGAWSIQPPTYALAVVAALYLLGGRGRVGTRHRAPRELGRSAAFWGFVVTLLVAFDSPVDDLADRSFAMHMVQHVLILTVAPPLFALAAPWTRLWRPFPLGVRRAVARGLVVDRRTGGIRAAAKWLVQPQVVWLLFCGNLVAWHIPAAFDLTLRSEVVHQGEHALFLATGLLFWTQVIPSPPFHTKLGEIHRAFYTLGAMGVSWLLAVFLAFAPHPLYSPYADLAHRAGGLSALNDQQIAAGVMWVPGSLAFSLAIVLLFVRILAPAGARPLTPSLER